MIHHGDCLEVMAGMKPESVDAIVTDPPYGLEFMGKEWDSIGLKRGRHAGKNRQTFGETGSDYPAARNTATPSWAGQQLNPKCEKCGRYQWGPTPEQAAARGRTHHKCICERPSFRGRSLGPQMTEWHFRWADAAFRVAKPSAYLLAFGGTRTVHRMTVALEDAGWIIRDMLVWAYASGFPKSKASLKPAWEPVVMARKPGPLRMLAIDACRIEAADKAEFPVGDYGNRGTYGADGIRTADPTPAGRWPANVILTDPIFDGGWEGVVGGGVASYNPAGVFGVNRLEYESGAIYGNGKGIAEDGRGVFGYGDSGTYSRFFVLPKADRGDREPVLGGLPQSVVNITEGHGRGPVNTSKGDGTGIRENRARANSHPTVKPVDLMRHLIRLVTPTGGVVLDPFLGSGTTAIAAEMEGFDWIGIEKEREYCDIAEARLNGTQRGLGLPA